jgi:signal transduction histidine kinase
VAEPHEARTLGAPVSAGLLAVVRADGDLNVIDASGEAGAGIVPGRPLCDQIPALFGLEDQIQTLKSSPGRRIEMPNVSVVSAAEASARRDISVVFDHPGRCFIVAIMPSLANNALAIEREQSLRQQYVLEQALAEQTRAVMAANEALARTNADLVDFTRIVSHDLKAPMRAIRYSTEDIDQAMREDDAAAQATALGDLRFQTTRLARLVSDLLAYSRLDDKAEADTEIDTRQLLGAIVSSLPRPSGLEIDIVGEWPSLRTAEPLLDLVLRNLIDNAIKHHDTGIGMIEVTGTLDDQALTVGVVDDGPGIPERHRAAVLAPFAKLATGQDPGSGLGLAMVDKVLRNRGGRIEVGDRLDGARGARIVVIWPLTIQFS